MIKITVAKVGGEENKCVSSSIQKPHYETVCRSIFAFLTPVVSSGPENGRMRPRSRSTNSARGSYPDGLPVPAFPGPYAGGVPGCTGAGRLVCSGRVVSQGIAQGAFCRRRTGGRAL